MSPTSKTILQILRKQPATAKQLSELTGKTRQYIGQEIAQIRQKPGKIHVSAWQGRLSKEEAIYSAGRGDDVPKPATAQEIVLATMQANQRPMTVNEIADLCDLTPQTVGRCIHRIAKQTPVRIAEWVVARGPHAPRYELGDKPDAENPPQMTIAERVRNYRNTERGAKIAAKCRRRWRKTAAGREYAKRLYENRTFKEKLETGGLAAVDPLMAAIMGVK